MRGNLPVEFSKRKNKWRNRTRMLIREHLRPWWQDFQWPVVVGLVLLTVVLGYIGFSRHFEAIGETRSVSDYFYLSLQLFTLESGAVLQPIPWQLEVARLLAPTLAIYTAVQALIAIFREQFQLLRIRFLIKNHVVVCGLGRRGLELAKRFHVQGYPVAVIERDEENPLIEQCREQDVIVLVGNAEDRNLLRKAGVCKASYLVSVCGEDGINAEVGMRTLEIAPKRKGHVLTAFIHIVDLELCNLLREKQIDSDKSGTVRLDFFNVLESGARIMLNEFSLISEQIKGKDVSPHIVIVGLGKMGRSLLVQAVRNWWINNYHSKKRLRITIVDKSAERKKELLLLRYPQLDKVCDLIVQQVELNSPEFERGGFLFNSKGHCDVNAIYLCFDDDVHALAAALTLQNQIASYKVPIIIRMTKDAGMATLMRGESHSSHGFDNLHAFGLLNRTCDLELLLGGAQEIIARAIHEDYARYQRSKGHTPETNPSMVEWDQLPEDLKNSNRHQVTDIDVKLETISCAITPLTDWTADVVEFTKDEVELMAKMEHDRWMDERRSNGWTYALGPKNLEKKTSPYLVPWEKLSEDIQDFDRNTVRGLPAFLARAGFQIYRLQEEG